MLKLYTTPICPYCDYVKIEFKKLGVKYETIDASTPKNREELIKLGGKSQVPFLVDTTKDVKMYESRDIVKYVKKTYF